MRIYKDSDKWMLLDKAIKEKQVLTASKACKILGISVSGKSIAAVRQAALELGHAAIDCPEFLVHLKKRENYKLKIEIKNKLKETRGNIRYLLVEENYYYSIMDRLKT